MSANPSSSGAIIKWTNFPAVASHPGYASPMPSGEGTLHQHDNEEDPAASADLYRTFANFV